MRAVRFPGRGLPGKVEYFVPPLDPDDEPEEGEITDPRGTVEFPARARLTLRADGAADLGAVREMASDAFDGLELTGVTDDGLAAIGSMTGTGVLILSGDFTDAGLGALAGMTALRMLVLDSPLITGAAPLPAADLGVLMLAGERLTDAVFSAATSSAVLDLTGPGITGAGVARLSGSQSLRMLALECPNLAPDALRGLAGSPGLQSITLRSGTVDTELADALLSLAPPLNGVTLPPGGDSAVVERLLGAGLEVNGVAATPDTAGTLARVVAGQSFDEPDAPVPGQAGGLRALTAEPELDELLAGPVPVLVELSTPWCGPCKALAPVLGGLLEDRGGALLGVEIDIDASAWARDRFGVSGVPTVLLYRAGRETFRFTGVRSRRQIEELLSVSGVRPGQRR